MWTQKAAIGVLCENSQKSQEEGSGHLQQAQIRFLENRPLMSLATGYTGDTGKQELDLSTLVFREADAEHEFPDDEEEHWNVIAGESGAVSSVGHEQSASRSVAALGDDDKSTVKELSEDGHSYDGTVVRGGLRRDSE